jgi:threonine aldolase
MSPVYNLVNPFKNEVVHPDLRFNTLPPKDALIPWDKILTSEAYFLERYNDPSLLWSIDVYQKPHEEYLRLNELAEKTITCGYHHGLLHREVEHLFYQTFGGDIDKRNVGVFFTPTGTSANRLLTTAVLDNRSSIITHDGAHLIFREGVSVEAQTGSRVFVLPAKNGRLVPEQLNDFLNNFTNGSVITQIPKVFSLSNPSEEGIVYNAEELYEFAVIAHQHGLLFQIDGARLFHAAAFLDCSLKEISTDVGVDMLALGGSKCGMYKAEAAIFLPSFYEKYKEIHLYKDAVSSWNIFRSILKRQGNLLGQSSGSAIQFARALHEDYGINLAKNGNNAARLLAEKLTTLDGFDLYRPVESNTVFLSIPKKLYPHIDLEYSQLQVLLESDPTKNQNMVIRFIAANSITEKDVDITYLKISNIHKKHFVE